MGLSYLILSLLPVALGLRSDVESLQTLLWLCNASCAFLLAKTVHILHAVLRKDATIRYNFHIQL